VALVQLDGRLIYDWASFHRLCKEAFGFPSFYGENMDAFIDCLTYIDERDGMSAIVLANAENLTIEITGSKDLQVRVPEIAEALASSVDSVNERFVEDGKGPRLVLRWL